MVASTANRLPTASKTVTSQGLFQARAATSLSAVLAAGCRECAGAGGELSGVQCGR